MRTTDMDTALVYGYGYDFNYNMSYNYGYTNGTDAKGWKKLLKPFSKKG
jgi:hypothetical protein